MGYLYTICTSDLWSVKLVVQLSNSFMDENIVDPDQLASESS